MLVRRKDKVQSSSFDEMTLFYKRFLKLIAVLPFEGQNYTGLTYRVLLVICCFSNFLSWSETAVYTINQAGVPSIDLVCETVVSTGLNARYYLLLRHRREFADLLEECRQIWKMCDKKEHRWVCHFERKVRLLFQCLIGSGVFVSVLYSSAAIKMTLEAARNNSTHTKYLPYKWFTDDAPNNWPGYKFNFVLQMTVGVVFCITGSTADTAFPLLIMLGAGYFRALQHRIYRAYNSAMENHDEPLRAVQELVICVRIHQRILNYCLKINQISQTVFFVQLLCTGYNMSLIGIKLAGTDSDKYKYVPLALFLMAQLFICQWAPDHLINESGAISTAAYSVSFPWMNHRMGKLLVLIIARAQRPVQMTAAGVVSLSLENFGSMLKGALSFFTVLRNFTA